MMDPRAIEGNSQFYRHLVNEFIDGLFTEEAQTRPSDSVKVEDLDLEMRLPEWFDEEKYNNGRRFFHDYCFGFGANMILGLLAVFSVPSIMKVLTGSRRSSSPYTAYKRYVSTLMHVMSWYEHELKPGSVTWQSLHTVRSRHLRAAKEATLKGYGTVSQRDLALTQFGFVGYAIIKPDKYSIRQIRKGDWEGFNHFWSTIGHMLGLEDRYNICRKNMKETRAACQIILDRVFTPCLENVPEHFEHMARVLNEGLGTFIVNFKMDTLLFSTKYLANVPGYVFTEEDRIEYQIKLQEQLKGKSEDIGIDTASLMNKCAVDGLPKLPPRLLYVRDFDSIETTPGYARLKFGVKYQLTILSILNSVYNTEIGRIIMNWVYKFNNFMAFNVPYKAMFKFGFLKAFVNMFVEDPKDDIQPKLNEEFYKPEPPETWYEKVLSIIW